MMLTVEQEHFKAGKIVFACNAVEHTREAESAACLADIDVKDAFKTLRPCPINMRHFCKAAEKTHLICKTVSESNQAPAQSI